MAAAPPPPVLVVTAENAMYAVPSLRNGAPVVTPVPARASAIESCFFKFWVATVNVPADENGQRRLDSLVVSETITTYQAAIIDTISQNAGNAVPAAGRAAAVATAVVNASADPNVRLQAIVVGSSVVAEGKAFVLLAGDFKNTEMFVVPFVTITHTIATGANQSVYSTATEKTLRMRPIMLALTGLTPAEADISYAVQKIAIAAPVRAGACLLETMHHYLPNYAPARIEAIFSQVLGESGQTVKDVFAAHKTMITDMIFHKSIHSITTAFMQSLATDPSVAENFVKVGLGSAAVGLPVCEAKVRTGRAYKAALNAVSAKVASCKSVVTMNQLTEALQIVESFPRVGTDLVAEAAAAAALVGTAHAALAIINRDMAIERLLTPAIEATGSAASFCYGAFKEMAQAADIKKATKGGTLLGSYALETAQATHITDFLAGAEMVMNSRKYNKMLIEKDQLPVYTINA